MIHLAKSSQSCHLKTFDQRSSAKLKKHVFCKILLQISCFFRFVAQKTLKMTILTSVWSEQHPNAGQNIQQYGLSRVLTSGTQREASSCSVYHAVNLAAI